MRKPGFLGLSSDDSLLQIGKDLVEATGLDFALVMSNKMQRRGESTADDRILEFVTELAAKKKVLVRALFDVRVVCCWVFFLFQASCKQEISL